MQWTASSFALLLSWGHALLPAPEITAGKDRDRVRNCEFVKALPLQTFLGLLFDSCWSSRVQKDIVCKLENR